MMMIARRKFLTGVIALVCAPAVVRAASLMPVHAISNQVYCSAVDAKGYTILDLYKYLCTEWVEGGARKATVRFGSHYVVIQS